MSWSRHGRAALQIALTIKASIHNRQTAGIKLGGDPNNRRHPHPEDRARASYENRNRNACDIAQANGSSQRAG